MGTPALACAALEIALNRYLQLEPAALRECAALAPRQIALEVADLGWTFVVQPHAGGVAVAAEADGAPDVRARAPSLRLLQLALRAAGGAEGLPAGLEIDGDTELLRRFNALLARVGFDPEELAAKLLGDGAAHRLAGGLRGLFGWGRDTAQRLSRDTAEYLREETGDLARRADIDAWMQSVDTLREDADRLEARLNLLERRAAADAS